MPLYDFECQECGPFVTFKGIEQRNHPAFCPECNRVSRRLVSAPNLALMPASRRKAHTINERSCHEPRVRRSHTCGTGCGCAPGKAARGGKTVNPAGGKFGQFQTASNKKARPWMLGH